jgi:hypothetical protein
LVSQLSIASLDFEGSRWITESDVMWIDESLVFRTTLGDMWICGDEQLVSSLLGQPDTSVFRWSEIFAIDTDDVAKA